MVLRLQLLNETEKARLYRFTDGETIWIPKSVCKSTLKFKPKEITEPECHEIDIEDWWWEKNQWDEESQPIDHDDFDLD